MTSENMVPDTSIDTVTTGTSSATLQEPSSTMVDTFDSFLKKIDLSREHLLEIALYFGGGIFCGFVVKKYHQYLVTITLVLIALVIAHYFDVVTVTINTDKIKSFLGCQSVPCDITFFSFGMQWIKEHVRATVSFVSGFIIGIWVG